MNETVQERHAAGVIATRVEFEAFRPRSYRNAWR
jgi:hypothetical protein